MKVTVTITPTEARPGGKPFWLVDVDDGQSSTGLVAGSYEQALQYAQRSMKNHFDARFEEQAR